MRFIAPPLFTLAALPYFLPKTAHNLRKYVSDLEDKHAPEFAASHDRLNQALELHWHMAVDKLRGAGDEARVWSSQAVHSVEEATGLKVADAVRLGQERVRAVETKVEAKAAEVKQAAAAAKAQAKVEAEAAATVASTPAAPAPAAQVVEVQPVAVIVAPVDPAVVVPTTAVVPVTDAAPEQVKAASAAAPVVVAVPAPAAPAAAPAVPAKAAEDKPEKPRDVVAKPVTDGGKRLV